MVLTNCIYLHKCKDSDLELRPPYMAKYFFKEDILRVLSSSFTVFNIDAMKFPEIIC